MKIIHINYSNDNSGASIAVKRINNMLNINHFQSEILVYSKNSNNKDIKSIKKKNILIDYTKANFHKIFKKILKIFFRINFKYSVNFNLFPSNLSSRINNLNSEMLTDFGKSPTFYSVLVEIEKASEEMTKKAIKQGV